MQSRKKPLSGLYVTQTTQEELRQWSLNNSTPTCDLVYILRTSRAYHISCTQTILPQDIPCLSLAILELISHFKNPNHQHGEQLLPWSGLSACIIIVSPAFLSVWDKFLVVQWKIKLLLSRAALADVFLSVEQDTLSGYQTKSTFVSRYLCVPRYDGFARLMKDLD